MTFSRAGIAAAVRALDPDDLAARRWYAHKGERAVSARLAHAFPLSDVAVLALVDLRIGEPEAAGTTGRNERYAIPFVRDPVSGTVREAAAGDGAWRALALAIAEARTIPALPHDPGSATVSGAPEAALVCRPAPGFEAAWRGTVADLADADERPLGRDQSNTSVVLGDTLLLKGYRRIQPGLNPDLELTAFLSEEAGFPGVPRLAGWAEAISRDGGAATVAMLQVFIADADDLYETLAERLAGFIAGPPELVNLEDVTGVAEDLGLLVAGLHAALASPPADAPDLVPRLATRAELEAWRLDVHRQLNRAIPAVAAVDPEAAAELRRESAAIAARASRFEALATAPLVMRIHADLHLGQVLVGDDGYRIIDFEGEPLRTVEDRRHPDSPLRDVASMLRSLDHVARSALRRAERRNGGALERPGLDVAAWIERARARFLAAYAEGLRRAGSPVTLDLDLLDAFEVAKETYEFTYAATVLPSWLWAPREGMRWLLTHGEDR
jgi:maltose alpha-D-glucosyltransferase / alpha-amylase